MQAEPTYITIVSGLPRSGTSLCMKMLEAGGLGVLTDGVRHADHDNPNGYYEYQPVKKTRHNPSWLEDAGGKAVKMVYLLLYDLPADYEYRVIFMRRELQEVVRSQEAMLQRHRQPSGEENSRKWAGIFQSELRRFQQWIDRQRNFTLLDVNYNELMQDPVPGLNAIRSFLDNRVEVGAMVKVIDPDLYRNRNAVSIIGVWSPVIRQ